MQYHVTYYRKGNLECIYYKDSVLSYPLHTHANHMMMGYLLNGSIRLVEAGRECRYEKGESFCILPDVAHSIDPVDDMPYSMIVLCIYPDQTQKTESDYSRKLKEIISNTPESELLIETMASDIGVSPYHMIRQFKNVCGLTPHQFQIQCRVRKAQRLLEEGKSVTEAAFATGFCDQSHFDRCFRKIVRLTPKEYKQSITRLP